MRPLTAFESHLEDMCLLQPGGGPAAILPATPTADASVSVQSVTDALAGLGVGKVLIQLLL